MPSDYEAFVRGLLLAQRLAGGQAVSTRVIREDFGVSRATAKRDIRTIEAVLLHQVETQRGERGLKVLRAVGGVNHG